MFITFDTYDRNGKRGNVERTAEVDEADAFTYITNAGDEFDETYILDDNTLVAYDYPTAQYVQLGKFDYNRGGWKNKGTIFEEN